LQNNIKRRPGNIGVDHGQKVPAAAKPAAVPAPAAAAPVGSGAAPVAAKPAASRAPVAATGTNMSEDKRAKLEAIRAAKRGNADESAPADTAHALATAVATNPATGHVAAIDAADSGSVAPGATGPVAAVGASMSEEKRAKLEAIRAAKRAAAGE